MEILWMAHTGNIHYLAQNSPSQVRLYLTQTRDFGMLSAWDRQQLKDKNPERGE